MKKLGLRAFYQEPSFLIMAAKLAKGSRIDRIVGITPSIASNDIILVLQKKIKNIYIYIYIHMAIYGHRWPYM